MIFHKDNANERQKSMLAIARMQLIIYKDKLYL